LARTDALLRLHKSLITRRSELRRRLGGELEDLGHFKSSSPVGDAADAAFDAGSDEMSSALAEMESKELVQIERALQQLKLGIYGVCEGCQVRIPVARLNALPYSTLCVRCQREAERDSSWLEDRRSANWDKVAESDAQNNHREVDLSDIEMDLSK
jgi:DnaK suppressor protein